MNTTYLTDAAELTAQYPDARPPKNGLPWQSDKIGIDAFISDQNGCVFLIVRHDPSAPLSRLARTFFRDKPTAAIAVIECANASERTALLTPIQKAIRDANEEASAARQVSSMPRQTFDLDAVPARVEPKPSPPPPVTHARGQKSHSLRSFYLMSEAQLSERFTAYRGPENMLIKVPGSLQNYSRDRSTLLFTAFNEQAYYALLVRIDIVKSKRNDYVREVFNTVPDAYAWVIQFDDRILRDTFVQGMQHRLLSSLTDGTSDDEDIPDGGSDIPDGGSDDTGVPAVTIRPTPTRSGSAANDLPEEDEPEVFYIGPEELAETPVGDELVPARV